MPRLLNSAVRFYVVQRGDTLSAIGARLNIPWRTIARLNHLPNPDLIHPAQLLQLPDPTHAR